MVGSGQVGDVVAGQADAAGAGIEEVYTKVVPLYAVYRTAARVVVHHADDPALGSEQRRVLVSLDPDRGEADGLIDGWRSGVDGGRMRARRFERRLADALQVALQGEPGRARSLLVGLKADIAAERTSIARADHLCTAALATLAAMAALGGLAALFGPAGLAGSLCAAGAAGAAGAFFSVALAVRGRRIGIGTGRRDDRVDAGLRIVIGAISAAMLHCLVEGGIVTLGIGGTMLALGRSGTAAVAANMAAAFAAGFSERMIGDVLGRSLPAMPTGAVVAGIATGEADPLGVRRGGVAAPVAANDAGDGCCIGGDAAPTLDAELPPASGGIAGEARLVTGARA